MAKPSRAAYWAEILRDFRHSGLTQRQFCHERGVSYHSLRWWIGRTGKAVPGEARADARHARRRRSLARLREPSPSFLPVRLVADAAAEPREPIHVILAGSRRIAVRPGFDAETLLRVVEALERRGC